MRSRVAAWLMRQQRALATVPPTGAARLKVASTRASDQIASAPQPLLIPAPVLSLIEAPLPNSPVNCFLDSQNPRELPNGWQFSCRYRPSTPSARCCFLGSLA